MILRILRPREAYRVAAYLRRNRVFHAPYQQLHDDTYFTDQEQKAYLRYELNKYFADTQFSFWIFEKDNEDTVIGRLSFSSVIRGALNSCLVGYHLDQEKIGLGYMQEALLAGCEYMFTTQKLHRIQADIMPDNTRSINTILSCGFRLQGCNERYMCIAGNWRDHEIYARLNEKDWFTSPDKK